LARRYDEERASRIARASADRQVLEGMPVTEYVDLYAGGRAL
jgi:hypothetical protein